MKRNYSKGQYDSIDVDLDSVGSDPFKVMADGLEGSAFSDMEIFSDSARVIPIPPTAWENYKLDKGKTENEALDPGKTDKEIYSELKVNDPTYQSVPLYVTFNNWGTYPNGDVLGVDYISVDDADKAYTTQRALMTYIIFENLTADRTLTVTDGGFDERSRFKVVNKSDTYSVTVNDSVELEDYNVSPEQSTDFYDLSETIVWASGGWEVIYPDQGTATTKTEVLKTDFLRVPKTGDFLEWVTRAQSLANQWGTVMHDLIDISADCYSSSAGYSGSAYSILWDASSEKFIDVDAQYIRKARLWHDAK